MQECSLMTQTPRRPTLVIAGTGRAASLLVEEICGRAPGRFQVRMFGGEPQPDRILLSGILAGGDPDRLCLHSTEWFEERGVLVHAGVKVESIDRKQRRVIGAGGKVVEP